MKLSYSGNVIITLDDKKVKIKNNGTKELFSFIALAMIAAADGYLYPSDIDIGYFTEKGDWQTILVSKRAVTPSVEASNNASGIVVYKVSLQRNNLLNDNSYAGKTLYLGLFNKNQGTPQLLAYTTYNDLATMIESVKSNRTANIEWRLTISNADSTN